ncbi:MAG: 16S rRNA (cytosine(967)-C(5))-methyltransferase RsmB [Candidatus Electryonea clarkiae]|nr:16S rRNA (cytosine(967)-C(5))-methyltransferase RsmB [Candidatus Electryonea clarkiae]MDP8286873.1 16S rRNA (cytosine(967)-C(5))-methyltransferase RsmB [Candidatus Electryonea clarkiae]
MMVITLQNPRKIAVKIIEKWLDSNKNIDNIRDQYLNDNSLKDDRDRALVNEIIFGVIRNNGDLNQKMDILVQSDVKKMQNRLKAILLTSLYQIFYLDRVPAYAIIDESVNLTREIMGEKPTGLVNAVLRKATKMEKQDGQTVRPVNAFYAGVGILSQWRNKWVQQWGEEKTDELIQFFGNIPSTGLRRNRLKTNDDKSWIEILVSEGVEPEGIPGWDGYAYAKKIRPSTLPSFEKGLTTVQDPGAGLAIKALDPQPGENILDLCCAPGGKTALIWEIMQGEGTLTGVDKSMKRNKLTREGLKRLGHEGVKVISEDVVSFSEGEFDRVLIDVPCSGTGVAHRRADLLLKRPPLRVFEISKLQRKLLEHAARRVKPGGVLVYSTCSLEPDENEKRAQITEKKLGNDFERDELSDTIPAIWKLDKGEAATWPPRDKVDGAYVVRWRRTK